MREAGDPFAALLEDLLAGMQADFAATREGAYRSFFDPQSPADTVDAAVEDALRTPRHAAISDMLHNIGAGTWGVARLVEQHVHWIYAVGSPISNPDLATQTFRSVSIHPIQEGGHFVHLETPHAVNVALGCLPGECGPSRGPRELLKALERGVANPFDDPQFAAHVEADAAVAVAQFEARFGD